MISTQPLYTHYQYKKVLSIGARKNVLEDFSAELISQGFDAQWTNLCNDTNAIIKKYDARNYDVITFGRGVTAENKKFLMEKFRKQHPDIVFVEGLAPIAGLLVDQVKLALTRPRDLPTLNWGESKVTVSADVPSRIVVKHYRLNWLFQAREKTIFDGQIEGQKKEIIFQKKKGRNFVTITCNGLVVAVNSI